MMASRHRLILTLDQLVRRRLERR